MYICIVSYVKICNRECASRNSRVGYTVWGSECMIEKTTLRVQQGFFMYMYIYMYIYIYVYIYMYVYIRI